MDINSFRLYEDRLVDTGYKPVPKAINFSVKDAKIQMRDALSYCCGPNVQWLEGYDDIAQWLGNNEGKGLMMVGGCGLGKTVIGAHVIPVILIGFCKLIVNVFSATEMNNRQTEIMSKGIIYIDDVGTECTKNEYGNKKEVFAEIVDNAEKEGKLLIISTNLTSKQLNERYGDRVVDRLKHLTKYVSVRGTSLRI
jgi:DNA replication protein DnaC